MLPPPPWMVGAGPFPRRAIPPPAIDDPRRSEFFLHLSASACSTVFEIKKQQSPIGPLPRQPQQTATTIQQDEL
jgi:hypothetical protein